MLPTILIISGVILVLVIRRYFYVPRPKLPPLSVEKDNPKMQEAMRQAKETIDDFIQLQRQHPEDARVKVPFFTTSAETEYLWAAVRGIDNQTVEVLLLTPPVTHTGQVDRVTTYQLKDIVDWWVLSNGKIKGGYTMRAMFAIAREKWGELPKALRKEELKYE